MFYQCIVFRDLLVLVLTALFQKDVNKERLQRLIEGDWKVIALVLREDVGASMHWIRIMKCIGNINIFKENNVSRFVYRVRDVLQTICHVSETDDQI